MMGLRFHPEARREYQAAILRHERARPGFGELFIDAVEAKVEQAARFPESGARVAGFDEGHAVLRYALSRFSYKVVVARVRGEAIVIAVAHDRRRPGYWRTRLR